MSAINKYTLKKLLVVMIWIMMGAGTVVLLIAAISKRNNERCTDVEIKISGIQNNFFIDKNEVLKILESSNGGTLKKKPVHQIDIASMESQLSKSPWVRNVELYFDNNDVLRVNIKEREPVARIFTTSGRSFYIDTSLTRLSLSDKFSPRLPVFTSFPSDAAVLSKQDSALMTDIRTFSEFFGDNPFWMAQIDQVDITANGEFDLIPKLGNTIIHFGDANDYRQKFNNLLCFYKQVLTKIGWDHYAAIDAQFKGQIVGVRKDAGEVKADAARSVQIMKAMIEDAQKQSDDSTNIQLDQSDDDNNNIHTSQAEDSVPSEDVVEKGQKKGSVTPIHVPEKPTSNGENSLNPKPQTIHSTSVEKPNPNPSKPDNAKEAKKQNDETEKRIPKAVMPPQKTKSEY